MIKLEKLEKGEFFEDAFLVSYRYNKDYLNKMRSLKYKRYVPDKKAWEIPSSELKHLVDLFGVDDINVNAKYLEGLVEKEESKAEETPEDIKERLKDIKPIVDYPFKTKPFPHQIEAFNRGYECKDLLLADDQGLGKTKESIDIAVARKGEIGKCLIVCGVNSVKYNGNGLRVNGKDLNSIISAALGTIKKIPGRYEYLGEENKGKPFESQLCNVSVTIDDISTEITETITFAENGNVQEVTLAEFEKGLEDEHSQEVKQADPEE